MAYSQCTESQVPFNHKQYVHCAPALYQEKAVSFKGLCSLYIIRIYIVCMKQGSWHFQSRISQPVAELIELSIDLSLLTAFLTSKLFYLFCIIFQPKLWCIYWNYFQRIFSTIYFWPGNMNIQKYRLLFGALILCHFRTVHTCTKLKMSETLPFAHIQSIWKYDYLTHNIR